MVRLLLACTILVISIHLVISLLEIHQCSDAYEFMSSSKEQSIVSEKEKGGRERQRVGNMVGPRTKVASVARHAAHRTRRGFLRLFSMVHVNTAFRSSIRNCKTD